MWNGIGAELGKAEIKKLRLQEIPFVEPSRVYSYIVITEDSLIMLNR